MLYNTVANNLGEGQGVVLGEIFESARFKIRGRSEIMKFLILLLTVLPLAFSEKIKTACKCARVECPTVEPDVRMDGALPHSRLLLRGQDANHIFHFSRNVSARIKLLFNVHNCVEQCLRLSSAHSAALGHHLHP